MDSKISKQDTLRERLERWRVERGRKLKPEKPWLPVRRKQPSLTVTNGIGGATTNKSHACSTPLKTDTCNRTITGQRKNGPNEPRYSKWKLSQANAASIASKPGNKENCCVNSVTCNEPPVAKKSRRELLEEWRHEKQKRIAEQKKQEQQQQKVAAVGSRRKTFVFPSTGVAVCPQQVEKGICGTAGGKRRTTLAGQPTAANAMRRQTLLISHTKSPLLRRAGAKDVLLPKGMSQDDKRTAVTSGKSQVAAVSVSSVATDKFPVQQVMPAVAISAASVPARRSISSMHRAGVSRFHQRCVPRGEHVITAVVRRPNASVGTGTNYSRGKLSCRKSETMNKTWINCEKSNGVSNGGILRHSPVPSTQISAECSFMKPANLLKNVTFDVSVAADTPPTSPSLTSRLEYWLAIRGKTPSRFRHLHCFGVQLSEIKRQPRVCTPFRRKDPVCKLNLGKSPKQQQATRETGTGVVVDELRADSPDVNSDLKKLDMALADLLKLFERSYPLQGITDWLDEMYEIQSGVQKLSAYWECRAKVSERCGHPSEAIYLLTRGIDMGAEPLENLINLRKKWLQVQAFGTRILREVNQENAFSSTIIQYAVHEKPPSRCKALQDLVESSPATVFTTPIRRSNRLSQNAATPICVSSSRRSSVRYVRNADEIPVDWDVIRLANPALLIEYESPY